jgi:hypothetical protein
MSIKLNLTNLTETADLAPLYCKYPDQVRPQPAYVMLDDDGEVTADWSGEIGSSTPMRCWHGVDMRWSVAAAIKPIALIDYLQGEALPLLERIHAGHSVDWDGNNHVGSLSDDAQEASDDLRIGLEMFGYEYDRIAVWDVSEWLFNCNKLTDHWRDQSLDEAVTSIEAGATSESVKLLGDVRDELLDEVERRFDEAGDELTDVHVAALLADGRITQEQVDERAAAMANAK